MYARSSLHPPCCLWAHAVSPKLDAIIGQVVCIHLQSTHAQIQVLSCPAGMLLVVVLEQR